MTLIEDLRETVTSEHENEAAAYQCVDCHARYDETKRLCPECGSEKVDLIY